MTEQNSQGRDYWLRVIKLSLLKRLLEREIVDSLVKQEVQVGQGEPNIWHER